MTPDPDPLMTEHAKNIADLGQFFLDRDIGPEPGVICLAIGIGYALRHMSTSEDIAANVQIIADTITRVAHGVGGPAH